MLPKYNLVCSAGHRHWSPTPLLFVGKTCLSGLKTETGASRRCQERLRRI